ncbi:MAG: L-serine ammonia-lyase, iron-sulfur-dependent, subunit alpha [Firmicutes bacterium]|nr:L-serine ammonia-lyase, iron-sulfur-dependent, subunit alpha [Bacillota bacterium]
MALLEIIGPVMVGPSSSHTAGAVRLGNLARAILDDEPAHAIITLHGSFAATGRGHGTDLALVAGLLGLTPADERIPESRELARQCGLDVTFRAADLSPAHPNTALFELTGRNGGAAVVWGRSLGAGKVEVFRIGDLDVQLSGEYATLVLFHEDRPGVIAAVTSSLAAGAVNIARMRVTRAAKGGRAITVLELDQPAPAATLMAIRAQPGIRKALAVPPLEGEAPAGTGSTCSPPPPAELPAAKGVEPPGSGLRDPADFSSFRDLVQRASAYGLSLGKLAVREEARRQAVSPKTLQDAMAERLRVMQRAIQRGLSESPRSRSGLVGGDAARLQKSAQAGQLLGGPVLAAAMARALAVAEVNACMGVVVAAPTAGSCGVLPGVLSAVAEALKAPEERQVDALFAAAAVGEVVAAGATLSGAEGGCQAEIGSAAAMAAAAAVELAGGRAECAAHAAALALKGLMGLVCDPVCGLVEVPCVKRNASAAAVALACADMAMAGVRSAVPPDEVITAVAQVGRAMPESLRETGLSGLAATPTARRLCQACAGCNEAGPDLFRPGRHHSKFQTRDNP